MKLKDFLELEINFEKGIFAHDNAKINSYLKILELTRTGDFESFYSQIENKISVLNNQASTSEIAFEKGCCWILMILVSETQYNLKVREQALLKFQILADQNYVLIFEFYRMLFKAVGYAFQSLQIEALSCYTRSLMLAESCDYQRGIVRSLTGTGLIQQEIGNTKESKHAFKKGLSLAKSCGFDRSAIRLNTFIDESRDDGNVGQGFQIENLLVQETQAVLKLISENDLLYARKRLTEAEILRRQSGISRKAYSLYVWSAVISGLRGKKSLCERTINNLNDRVLKLQALKLLNDKNFELSTQLLTTVKILESEITNTHKDNQVIDLSEIKNINVRELLKFLSTAVRPVTKAELFENVFKISYDPVIHDAKLYKLIMFTRKEVGGDVIINHHGTYSCNIKKFQFVG